jgi:HD superfamily phosphodiesterase
MENIILPKHKNLYQEVKNRFKDTNYFYYGPYDETFFTHQVYRNAREILQEVDADEEVVLVSSLLHDIGKTLLDENLLFKKETHKSEWLKHPQKGVELTMQILKEFGYSSDFIEKVCFIVENHDKRKEFHGEKTNELKIVQDADWIADGGIAGLIRPFLWVASNKVGTLGNIEYVLSEPSRYDENEILNLDVSKQLSKKMFEDEIKVKKMLKQLVYFKN